MTWHAERDGRMRAVTGGERGRGQAPVCSLPESDVLGAGCLVVLRRPSLWNLLSARQESEQIGCVVLGWFVGESARLAAERALPVAPLAETTKGRAPSVRSMTCWSLGVGGLSTIPKAGPDLQRKLRQGKIRDQSEARWRLGATGGRGRRPNAIAQGRPTGVRRAASRKSRGNAVCGGSGSAREGARRRGNDLNEEASRREIEGQRRLQAGERGTMSRPLRAAVLPAEVLSIIARGADGCRATSGCEKRGDIRVACGRRDTSPPWSKMPGSNGKAEGPVLLGSVRRRSRSRRGGLESGASSSCGQNKATRWNGMGLGYGRRLRAVGGIGWIQIAEENAAWRGRSGAPPASEKWCRDCLKLARIRTEAPCRD